MSAGLNVQTDGCVELKKDDGLYLDRMHTDKGGKDTGRLALSLAALSQTIIFV